MSPRPTRQIHTALLRKGFVEDDTHHHMFWLMVNGKRSLVRTRYSHGERECDDWHLCKMAQQVGLSRKEFDDLIDCPLKKETYLSLLRERGVIRE